MCAKIRTQLSPGPPHPWANAQAPRSGTISCLAKNALRPMLPALQAELQRGPEHFVNICSVPGSEGETSRPHIKMLAPLWGSAYMQRDKQWKTWSGWAWGQTGFLGVVTPKLRLQGNRSCPYVTSYQGEKKAAGRGKASACSGEAGSSWARAMPIMQGLVCQMRLPDSLVRAAESHQTVLSKL